MEAINEVRLKLWKQQDAEFFREAVIDADGTIAPTTGECKEGMNISYDGQWSYHPLIPAQNPPHVILHLLDELILVHR